MHRGGWRQREVGVSTQHLSSEQDSISDNFKYALSKINTSNKQSQNYSSAKDAWCPVEIRRSTSDEASVLLGQGDSCAIRK